MRADLMPVQREVPRTNGPLTCPRAPQADGGRSIGRAISGVTLASGQGRWLERSDRTDRGRTRCPVKGCPDVSPGATVIVRIAHAKVAVPDDQPGHMPSHGCRTGYGRPGVTHLRT